MIDLQLLAIAGAILIVVVLISFFLLFSNRERSFEDALAERQGLSTLLSGAADLDHKKQASTSKEQKKKPKAVGAVKKSDHKKKTEDPSSGSEVDQKRQILGDILSTEATGFVSSQIPSAQCSNETAKKSSAKKHSAKKEKTAERTDFDSSDAHPSTSLQESDDNLNKIFCSSPIEQEIVVSKSVELNEENVPVVAESMQKKKQKLAEKFEKVPLSTTEADYKVSKAFDVVEEEISLNSALCRFNLPVLSNAQQEIVAKFYKNEESWCSSPSFKASGKAKTEEISLVHLKKQMDEKDALLTKEAQKTSAALQALKDAKHEISQEKERFTTNDRRLKETLVALQNEKQSSAQQMMDYQAQIASKMQTFRQMETQLMQSRVEQKSLSQLQQENQRSKERISSAEQEMLARNSELQMLKKEILNRDSQIHRFEQQRNEAEKIRALKFAQMHEAGVSQQLMDSQSKLIMKDQECSQLMEQVKVLRNEFSLLEQDHKLLHHQVMQKESLVQVLSQETSAQNDTKRELERCQVELSELKHLFESTQLKEQQLCKQMADKEINFKKSLVEKENSANKFQSDIDFLRAQMTKLTKEKETKEDVRLKELENALKAKNKLDTDVYQLTADLECALKKLNEKDAAAQCMKSDLDSARDLLAAAEKTVENLKDELNQNVKSQSNHAAEQLEQLQQQAEHLDTTLARRNATIKHLEDQMKEQSMKTFAAEKTAASLQELCEKLTAETKSLIQKCNDTSSEKHKLTEQLKLQQNGIALNGHSADVTGVVIDPEVLKVNERSMTQLNKQLINKDVEMAHLKEQLEALRKKNSTLRDEKCKTAEVIQLLENNAKELTEKAEAKWSKSNEALKLEKETRDKLTHLLPNTMDLSTKNFSEWLCCFENELKNSIKKSQAQNIGQSSALNEAKKLDKTSGFSAQICSLRSENESLRSSCEAYKNSLISTESALQRLENIASENERTCDFKIAYLEKQLQQLKTETCSRLEEQLESSTQVHSQLYSFKKLLEKEISEREALINQLSERDALLNEEKAAAKLLSTQAAKLRGLLKTGQDALKHEESLVEKLHTQVTSLQKDNSSRTMQEQIEELQNQLEQRNQQLKKELQNNKN